MSAISGCLMCSLRSQWSVVSDSWSDEPVFSDHESLTTDHYNLVKTSSTATGSLLPSSNSTRIRRARISWASTRPWPFGVSTRVPTLGSCFWNSSYTSCSNRKQHLSRPHRPEILDGSSVLFCTLAMRIDTGGITVMCVLQQTGLPQSP